MTVVLCIAGICAVLAGLLAIVFGIPIQEFSFGNTLILAGAIAACSGVLVLAQAAVVRELKAIARKLGPRAPAEAGRAPAPPVAPPLDPGGEDAELAPGAVMRSWRRDRMPPEPPAADAAPSRRRHLMFSARVRKDPGFGASPASPEAVEIDGEEAEDAWQRSERLREVEPQQEWSDASERQPPRAVDPQATVIKSGVVQGMDYALYSDGSIEAKLPEGLMRFATIEELRAHLDRHL